ncbi:MAG: thioredoxin family protein [Verrucomicrobiota bacterium]
MLCAAVFLGALSAQAGDAAWGDNFEAAVEKAKEENKPILMDFTGSDWCGWCVRLDKEVFSQSAFKDYAADNLVLMEIDFPRDKILTDKVKEQNNALKRKYGIRGYPTLILLSPDEKILWKGGYMPGGPDAMIAELKKHIPAKS